MIGKRVERPRFLYPRGFTKCGNASRVPEVNLGVSQTQIQEAAQSRIASSLMQVRYQNRVLPARIAYALPVFDPATRTLKV